METIKPYSEMLSIHKLSIAITNTICFSKRNHIIIIIYALADNHIA